MNYPNYLLILLALFVANWTRASSLTIENFDSYADTVSFYTQVLSSGEGARLGKLDLDTGSDVDGTNAACFKLTWYGGNHANLILSNLEENKQNLRTFSAIQASLYIETASGYAAPAKPTMVKLLIEGTNGAIWQTKAENAVQPVTNTFDQFSFAWSSDEMEPFSGIGSLEDTLSSVLNIWFQFENGGFNNLRICLQSFSHYRTKL